jgi:hypothetical protein
MCGYFNAQQLQMQKLRTNHIFKFISDATPSCNQNEKKQDANVAHTSYDN